MQELVSSGFLLCRLGTQRGDFCCKAAGTARSPRHFRLLRSSALPASGMVPVAASKSPLTWELVVKRFRV